MLSNVSWSEYLVITAILLFAYYFFIGATYFQPDIRVLLSGRFTGKIGDSGNTPANDNQIDELEAIVNDLRYAVLEKAGKPADKSELLVKLQQRLTGYSGLQKPAFRVAINNYIIQQAEEICGVVFSELELDSAWETLLR